MNMCFSIVVKSCMLLHMEGGCIMNPPSSPISPACYSVRVGCMYNYSMQCTCMWFTLERVIRTLYHPPSLAWVFPSSLRGKVLLRPSYYTSFTTSWLHATLMNCLNISKSIFGSVCNFQLLLLCLSISLE